MKKYYLYIAAAIFSSITALPAAHIGFMMPSGGQQGSSVDIIIGGQAFGGVREAWISGTGVTVEQVKFIPNLPNPDGKQRRWINQVLRSYHQNKPNNIPLPENTEGWRKHRFYNQLYDLSPCERDILYRFLLVPRNSLQASPAIAGRAIVTLKIASDAPIGEREFRLIDRSGKLSNPLRFFVGKHPEFREDFFPYPPAVKSTPVITIPGVINGQITPGEVDKFKFSLQKNQTVNFQLLGRYLNPFIGDGVPGHFQAIMEVVDSQGRTVAYADDYFFDPDPVLNFTAPAAGEYTLQIRDALYRGREDFVYRINANTGKFVPAPSIPPVIPGVKTIELGKLQLTDPVNFPVVLGHTLCSADGNNYQLKLKKNQQILLEVFARRLNLPPDSVIKVYDSDGNLLAHNDDTERLKAGLILHNTADSLLYFTAPEDDMYTVNVSDTSRAFGDACKYFLRIDIKRPRFAVYSVPSTLSLTAGAANLVSLIAERFDQFTGEIKLRIKSPANCTIVGADSIPANCDRTIITISAPHDPKRQIHNLEIEAYTKDFKTTVIPGDEATQAFAYTHIKPAATFPVRVLRRSITAVWEKKLSKLVLKQQPQIITARLTGGIPPGREICLEAVNPPEWLKIKTVKNSRIKTYWGKNNKKRKQLIIPPLQLALMTADQEKAAGQCANVQFRAFWKIKSKPDKNGKVKEYRQEILLPVLQIQGGKI